MKLPAPFKTKIRGATPAKVLKEDEIENEVKEVHEEKVLLRRHSIQNLFNGYNFDIEDHFSEELQGLRDAT